MFVRKKKNRSGTISVVVVDKRHGFKEVKNFGVVTTDEEAEVLCMRANEWIRSYGGQQLERIMKLMKFPMSVDKALEIAKTIPTVTMRLPFNQQKQTRPLFG